MKPAIHALLSPFHAKNSGFATGVFCFARKCDYFMKVPSIICCR